MLLYKIVILKFYFVVLKSFIKEGMVETKGGISEKAEREYGVVESEAT